jgi:hypothetical protein
MEKFTRSAALMSKVSMMLTTMAKTLHDMKTITTIISITDKFC